MHAPLAEARTPWTPWWGAAGLEPPRPSGANFPQEGITVTQLLPARTPGNASPPLATVDEGWRWARRPLALGVPMTAAGTTAMWYGLHSWPHTLAMLTLSALVWTWAGLADQVQCDHLTPTGRDTADDCPATLWVWGSPYGQVLRAARRGWLRTTRHGWRCADHTAG